MEKENEVEEVKLKVMGQWEEDRTLFCMELIPSFISLDKGGALLHHQPTGQQESKNKKRGGSEKE